jgi:hypothetical protein
MNLPCREDASMANDDKVETDDHKVDEMERYRRAAEDALQQLDWAIGYLHGIRKNSEARMLSQNRQVIRRTLLRRQSQPDPT